MKISIGVWKGFTAMDFSEYANKSTLMGLEFAETLAREALKDEA